MPFATLLIGLVNVAFAKSNSSIIVVFLHNFANFLEWVDTAFLGNANNEICLPSVGENHKFVEVGRTVNSVRAAEQGCFSIGLCKPIQKGLWISSGHLELANKIYEN